MGFELYVIRTDLIEALVQLQRFVSRENQAEAILSFADDELYITVGGIGVKARRQVIGQARYGWRHWPF